MGRFIENLAYGLPIMPFSDTPDGRIVHSLEKNRKFNENVHTRNLFRQDDIVTGLKAIHGGQMVSHRDFMNKVDQTNNYLSEQTHVAYEQLGELSKANDNLVSINSDLNVGFGNTVSAVNTNTAVIHDDLSAIDGTLKNEFAATRSTIRGEGKQTRKTIEKTTKRQFGPELSYESFNKSIDDPTVLFQSLCAYTKGMLKPINENELKNKVDIGFNSRSYKKETQNKLFSRLNELYGSDNEKSKNLQRKIIYSLSLFDTPSLLLEHNPVFYLNKLKSLREINSIFRNKKITIFLSNAEELLTIKAEAKKTPVSKDSLRNFTLNEFIKEDYQIDVMLDDPMATKRGTQVGINANLIRMNAQSDVTNLYLEKIATTMVKKDVHLKRIDSGIQESNKHLINIETYGKQFVEIAQRGFSDLTIVNSNGFSLISSDLNRIEEGIEITNLNLSEINQSINQTNEQLSIANNNLKTINSSIYLLNNTLLKTSEIVIKSLSDVKTEITTQTSFTNTLLESIESFIKESLSNIAKQRYRQGLKAMYCYEFDDAYLSFVDGINQDRTGFENHFGAGIAAEHQSNLDIAIEHFIKAANYAGNEEPEFVSACYQMTARLEYAIGSFKDALVYSSKAINVNPKNITAKFEYAKYIALTNNHNEVIDILYSLIEVDESLLINIKLEHAFIEIPIELLYIKLIDNDILKDYYNLRIVLFDFCALGNKEYAVKIHDRLFNNSVSLKYYYLKTWNIKLFNLIKNEIKNTIAKRLKSGTLFSAYGQRYVATFLVFHFEFPIKDVGKCFIQEMENDKYFHLQKSKKIIEQLNIIDNNYTEQFMNKVEPEIKHFSWLFKKR